MIDAVAVEVDDQRKADPAKSLDQAADDIAKRLKIYNAERG